jgi:carbamate kinase
MPDSVLVALGGHALEKPGEGPAIRAIRELLRRGHRVLITHGNGPQVRPEGPLDVAVARTQGEIGYLLARRLPAVTVVTRALVDPGDPRLRRPTKPVGPERRLVPSPMPVRILEIDAIRRLFEAGFTVIAGGGGGIPVTEEGGVEAVIDKDLTSALIASELGIPRIVNVTSVDAVRLDFGTPRERPVARMTRAEAKRRLEEGHFAPGSMGPKVEAAILFLERGGREYVVSDCLEPGTRIVP